MDIKKVITNKYSNWEVTPKKRDFQSEALEAAQSSPISFTDVKGKYRTSSTDNDTVDSKTYAGERGIDKGWVAAFLSPKDKSDDAPVDQKVHFFDEEGNEVASQG